MRLGQETDFLRHSTVFFCLHLADGFRDMDSATPASDSCSDR